MITDDNIKEKVFKRLNSEFGGDLKNFSKCKELLTKIGQEKDDIEKEVLSASKSLTSLEAAGEINNVSQSIDEITKEFDSICKIVEENRNSQDEAVISLQETMNKVQQLEQGLSYLRCVRSIQEQSGNIETHLASHNDSEAVVEFSSLCHMCIRLQHSKCSHLKTFLSDMVHHWHNVLKDMFSLQMEEVLKSAEWPISSNKLVASPSTETMTRLQLIIRYLLNIQLPTELTPPPAVTSSLIGNFPPISLPITQLLKPLRKRFIYHFCGNRQTNRLDKPEWFMTQVLTYITDHEHFLNQWVQPVMDQCLKVPKSAHVEFSQGLVQLVVDKLHSDMPTLMLNDAMFSHTVDETLGFDKELRDSIGYPESLPSAVTVLTQAHVFVKWIHMERKYAREKMDMMLSSESAWAEVSGSEDLKITEAAEAFLTLLFTMTERYSILSQPGHRLQFVELQLELVDELRVGLLQLLHCERQEPLDSQLPPILNTMAHISAVLSEWGTSPHFLLLHHYRCQLETAGSELSAMDQATLQQGTVFDQALTLLQPLIQQLVDTLCDTVMMEVKAHSRPYRKDKWFAMKCDTCLTTSACPMFQVLVSKLHSLQSLLAAPLFTTAWQSIATHLCSFLLEELVLQNRFNTGGAKQLEQDLNRSIIPVFHQYTDRPEAYFMPLKEACSLLNITPLPVDWSHGNFDTLPIQIYHLSPESVRSVIQRRADIIPDLM